jgi:hypothetical protein
VVCGEPAGGDRGPATKLYDETDLTD